MKRVHKSVFVIITVFILCLAYFSVFGLHITTENKTQTTTSSVGDTVSQATSTSDTAMEVSSENSVSSVASEEQTDEQSATVSTVDLSSQSLSSQGDTTTTEVVSEEASQPTYKTTTYIKGIEDIRWGIDIRGGIEATFAPAEDGINATKEQMESVKSIIELRLVENNITDYELYADADNNKVIVRFPWKETETEFNPESAIEELASTAMLTFRPGAEYSDVTVSDSGEYQMKTPTGDTAATVLLDGNDVKSAAATISQDQTTGKKTYQVSLEFTDDGAKKFEEATGSLVGQQMSIWMDDIMISAPTVNEAISGGQAVITGNFTSSEASKLASKINAGALPFSLKVANYGTISPTLGAQALKAMGIAAIIALLLIWIFMIVRYRVPGLVACLALLGQMAIAIACISGFFPFVSSFTMTLPGIAGIILSIGMGVDANIIMDERIKDELDAGKSLDSAINAGSKNSFAAIFDGNITVIIVAIILMLVFGPSNILSALFGTSTTGTVYSFGYTLLIGVISNFIMGVAASRYMLKSISGYKGLRSKALYGGAKE